MRPISRVPLAAGDLQKRDVDQLIVSAERRDFS